MAQALSAEEFERMQVGAGGVLGRSGAATGTAVTPPSPPPPPRPNCWSCARRITVSRTNCEGAAPVKGRRGRPRGGPEGLRRGPEVLTAPPAPSPHRRTRGAAAESADVG